MFVSAEWQESKHARVSIEGSHVEGLVMSQKFWQEANRIVKAFKPLPLYGVLRVVDTER